MYYIYRTQFPGRFLGHSTFPFLLPVKSDINVFIIEPNLSNLFYQIQEFLEDAT